MVVHNSISRDVIYLTSVTLMNITLSPLFCYDPRDAEGIILPLSIHAVITKLHRVDGLQTAHV
jgi:hypothetical protein